MTIIGILCLSMFWVLAPKVKAEGPVEVHINSDGSVAPSFAPISSHDNVTYTFTGNISNPTYNGVVVDRSNIVIDGNGYTVQGNQSGNGISLTNISNVTIERTNIERFSYAIYLFSSNNNTISGNNAKANSPYHIYPPSAFPPTRPSAAGIFLASSSYNTVSGNSATANRGDGIVLWSSSNNTVIGNNATANSQEGIDLTLSSYNTVVGNTATANNDNGIDILDSSNNTVSGNDAAGNKGDGIALWYSSGNVLRDNSMVGNAYAFGVYGGGPSGFVNDVDVSNRVDGKPVYYWVGEHDKKVPVDAGYVCLVNCSGITVQNLNLTGNEQGILLAYTTNSTVTQNNATQNDYGIYLYGSSNNTITRNTATANNGGIHLTSSSNNNIISGNTATANSNAGIDLFESSNNNVISGNNATANGDGISVGSSNNTVSGNTATANSYSGIDLSISSYNTVVGNNATANNADGIVLVYSSSNTVNGNSATTNAGCGIVLYASSNNTVIGNNATANGCGIRLSLMPNMMPPPSSWNSIIANNMENNSIGLQLYSAPNNTMYHNNFIENSVQVSVDSASLSNAWNDTYPSGGNYWSDYNGTDTLSGPFQNETGSDGIGDTPYIIDSNNTDHYPLMDHYVLNYSVTFTEQGLPSGSTWWVDLNGDNQSSTSDMISFSEPNGMYTYSTGTPSYTASPSTGSVSMNGENANEQITFTRALDYGLIIAAIAIVFGIVLAMRGFWMWRQHRVKNSTKP
jgi:parallel beta-helix repeat protein